MKEIWKDIKGFEGLYQGSNLGRIKSLDRKVYNKGLFGKTNYQTVKGTIRKYCVCGKDKPVVCLSKNGKYRNYVVSTVIYETFNNVKIKNNEVVINIDGDRMNCALDNLKLISKSEYEALQYDKGIRKAPKYEYYGEMLTIKEIATKNNITPDQITSRMRHNNWSIYEASEIPIGTFEKKERIKLWA